MGLFDVFKKCTCDICEKEIKLSGCHQLSDGYICSDCSDIVGLGEAFDALFTVQEMKELLMLPEGILRYRIASHICPNPGIALLAGETCYFANSSAKIGKEKKKTVTTTKGKKTEKTTESYMEYIPARFYMTSTRLIALADEHGFVVRLERLVDIEFNKDHIVIHAGARTYTVYMDKDKVTRLSSLWMLVGLSAQYDISIDSKSLENEIFLTKDIKPYIEK